MKPHGRMAGFGALAPSLALGLAGCATPAERVAGLAQAQGFERQVVAGADFEHVVYFNHRPYANGVLHVYIEGDGEPYLNRWMVAQDPTPHQPVMLSLMGLDSAAAVYVGRPCYFGLAQQTPCIALDWTTGRFSERVVKSMASVIEQLLDDGDFKRAELFGHSGGGTLAVLVAMRLPKITHVVTLAGNLDTDRWCDLHRYSRLEESLNPALLGVLPVSTHQKHFVGMRDKVTPPSLVDAAARSLGASGVEILPGVSHQKGWKTHWPAILGGQ